MGFTDIGAIWMGLPKQDYLLASSQLLLTCVFLIPFLIIIADMRLKLSSKCLFS